MKREPNASTYEHFSVELETCITSDGALSTSVAGHVKNCRFWNRQSESATNRAAKPLVDQHAERLWIVCEFDHISVTIIGSEHVRLRSSSHGTYVVRSDQKRCGYVLWIHLWLQSTRARWIKWRGQTWHACGFVPRDSPESADMCLSAGQRIAISGLGSWEIALGVVLPRKNLSQRGFRLSDSAMWIVRLWVAWHGRLLAPSDSPHRRTAGIPADQILQRPR